MTADDRTNSARRFALALAIVTLVAVLLRAWGLGGDPLLGDDRLAGVSAVNFVERGQVGPTMWHHPRLRDLLVYASRLALGEGKLGHVFPSLLLGVLAVPLIGLLGRQLAGARAGLLAAALLAIDALHVDYSRQAVQEAYTTFFGLAGVLLAVGGISGRRPGWLIAAGAVFGLGLGAKWSVAFPLAVMFAWSALRDLRDRGASPAARAARIAFAVAALIVLPAAVYLLTWTPWFLAGRDLLDWLELHRIMAAEVAVHGGFNPANLELPHNAWHWYLRPVAFADFTIGARGPVPYIAVTNPLVWLLTLPSVAWAGWRAWRARDEGQALLVALFAATYAPFLFTHRPIWVHSALAVLPFALVAVASLLARAAAAGDRGRRLVVGWLALSAVVAAPLYLLATGYALRIRALEGAAASYRPSFESSSRSPP